MIGAVPQVLHTFFFTYIPFFCGAATQGGSWPSHSWGFLDNTQWRTKVGRTPLDEWSARRRDLYLTTHNTYNRQISMPPVGFEPTISAGERPLTCWDRGFESHRAADLRLRPRGHWDRLFLTIATAFMGYVLPRGQISFWGAVHR